MMDATVNLQHTDLLSDERYQLKKYSYQLINGDQATNKIPELYLRPDAVAVLPYDEERQMLLLTRQFRLAAYLNGTPSGYVIEACAGLIDDNEQPEETAKREAMEELGYQLNRLEKIASGYTSVGAITEQVHFFIARYSQQHKISKGGGLEEEGEAVEIIEMGVNDALKKLQNGEFSDVKTILLLQHYFLRRT